MPTPPYVYLLPLGVALVTTLLLVPQVRRFAIEWRVGDKPNGRKLHAKAIPHLGGIAIFGGFFIALLVSLGLSAGWDVGKRVLALLPGLLILFGLGLVDDLRGLQASRKLLYQVLGASLVVSMGAGFSGLGGGAFLLLVGISIFWYVGICNSVNLIDGLDGLAAGTSLISALAFLVVGLYVDEPAVALVAVSLVGALIAFLRFNFHPARIFMGDTGSMFIGFALAFLACVLTPKLGFFQAALGGAAILGVPIMDTTTTIIRRLVSHRPIFQADGEHTHHNLMRIGFTHRGSVVVLYLLSGVFSVLGVGVLFGNWAWFGVAVGLGVVASATVRMLAQRRPMIAEQATHRAAASFPAPILAPESATVSDSKVTPLGPLPIPAASTAGAKVSSVTPLGSASGTDPVTSTPPIFGGHR